MLRLIPLLASFILILTVIFTSPSLRRELLLTSGLLHDNTISCCKEEEVLNSSGEFDPFPDQAVFLNKVVDYPKQDLAQNAITAKSKVLGITNEAGEEKWIEVSLAEQKLRAWEGSKIVMEFLISSGKWSPTPTGDFRIWYKTKRQRMEGGSKVLGTYYNLPNVPSNMFFYKGYAIHGAYWHNNFGHPMSHGCVNSPLDKVAELFEWAGPVVPEGQNVVRASAENPGTRVYVH